MIDAKIVLDGISPLGVRLTTFELTLPRFILSELNTHRVWSRNSASSRAIPVKKMIKDVLENPVIPVFWGKNQAGMQAKEELTGIRLKLSQWLWLFARYPACLTAYLFTKIGLHKQLANRIIEPWMWTKTIVTATEWDNFFELRMHEDAQPEIFVLATKMYEAYLNSKPTFIDYGEWYLPYITSDEYDKYSVDDLIKMSTARCARVSYLTHDGKKPCVKKDFELYHDLVVSIPRHSSPAEHQATPLIDEHQFGYTHSDKFGNMYSGNLKGWIQHRQTIA